MPVVTDPVRVAWVVFWVLFAAGTVVSEPTTRRLKWTVGVMGLAMFAFNIIQLGRGQ